MKTQNRALNVFGLIQNRYIWCIFIYLVYYSIFRVERVDYYASVIHVL